MRSGQFARRNSFCARKIKINKNQGHLQLALIVFARFLYLQIASFLFANFL